MMRKQYFTNCKHCGRQILMTRNVETGRFTPCDPEIQWFLYDLHSEELFVNQDGLIVHGRQNNGQVPYSQANIGYKKHSYSCKVRRSA